MSFLNVPLVHSAVIAHELTLQAKRTRENLSRMAERQRMREQKKRGLIRKPATAAEDTRERQSKHRISKKNPTEKRRARKEKERAKKALAGGDKMDIG